VLITLSRSHKKIKIKTQHRQINLMCSTPIQRIKIILHYLVNTKTTTLNMPTFKVLNKYKINTHKSKHYSTTLTQITLYLIKV
jgi:uncharacterized membrane protein